MQTNTHIETTVNGHSTGPEQDPESTTGQAPASGTGLVLLDALRSNLSLLGELAMRYQVETKPERPEDPPTITQPRDVYTIFGPEMSGLAQEQLRVLLLDIKNNIVGQRVIYQGTVNKAEVRPAEVLRPAVVAAVPNIFVVHNHPSGDPTPSHEDIDATAKIAEAAKLLGIDLLDHVVIGHLSYVSMREHGLVPR